MRGPGSYSGCATLVASGVSIKGLIGSGAFGVGDLGLGAVDDVPPSGSTMRPNMIALGGAVWQLVILPCRAVIASMLQ